MFWLLRKLLRIRVNVSVADAARRAKEYCNQQGWHWTEPAEFTLYLRKYEFMTNARMRGGNIFGTVDCTTGEVEAGPPVRR